MSEMEIEERRASALALFESKKFAELKKFFSSLPVQDTALLLSDMELPEAAAVFRLLPKDDAAGVLVELSPEQQEKLIAAFTEKELKPLLDELFVDDMVDIVEEMPAGVVKKILKNTDVKTRRAVNELLKFPKDCAGSIMTTEFVDIPENFTVGECFAHIRRTGSDKETVYTGYVIDPGRKLLGVVLVKDLFFVPDETPVSEVMKRDVITVRTGDDKEKVAHIFDKYDFLALPVLDAEDRLVGIVTVDDAMDVLQDENTEDFEKMAAISPSDKGYFEIGVFRHACNRIPWLLVLMVSATLTGQIISRYENAFAAIPVLVAMIPMLMDTGGNCGSQASTMFIRGLALEEMHPRDFWRVWFKEIRIALIVGVSLAAVNVVRVAIFYSGNGAVSVWLLALITSLTLIAEIVLAKSLGCILPMLAKKLHLDPALMASPLITTIVDACSVLLYFSIACRVLNLSC